MGEINLYSVAKLQLSGLLALSQDIALLVLAFKKLVSREIFINNIIIKNLLIILKLFNTL